MMKKKLAITLTLALLLTLCACQAAEGNAQPTAAPTVAPTAAPTDAPTQAPTAEPTQEPTPEPSEPPGDAPTPAPPPQDGPSQQPAVTPNPVEQPGDSGESRSAPPKDKPWGTLLTLLLLVLLALRIVAVQPGVQAKRQKSEFRRWLVYTQAVHDALRWHGFVRDKAETPAAFFGRIAVHGWKAAPLQALAQAENLMFYGHAAPYAEETAQARRCFRMIYGALKWWQKLLFQLQRICLPASRFDITKR